MVKKVKRFIVFVLFSFFYSLLAGKVAKATPSFCIIPKTEDGKLFYHGDPTSHTLNPVWCDDYGSVSY